VIGRPGGGSWAVSDLNGLGVSIQLTRGYGNILYVRKFM
jgi:hypothetical protein